MAIITWVKNTTLILLTVPSLSFGTDSLSVGERSVTPIPGVDGYVLEVGRSGNWYNWTSLSTTKHCAPGFHASVLLTPVRSSSSVGEFYLYSYNTVDFGSYYGIDIRNEGYTGSWVPIMYDWAVHCTRTGWRYPVPNPT